MPSDAIESADLSALVGRIYEAALDTSRWRPFLSAFAARLNSHAGLIWAHDFSDRTVALGGQGESFFTDHGMDPAALASFGAYYAQRNVWMDNPQLHRAGQVVTDAMLFDPSRLKATEYWADWLRPQDMFHTAAAIVEKHDDRSVNVTVVRSERLGPYGCDELAVIGALMPHLKAGFALHRRLHRLEALAHASVQVLEAIPFGVILLDGEGRALHVSDRAQALASACGLLRLSQGRPECSSPHSDAILQRLLHEATQTGNACGVGGQGGALRLNGLDGAQLQLLVTPLPSWSSPFGLHTAAAIFLSQPQMLIGSLTSMLRSLYGMTPAEARLTEGLVNGLTPQEYADARQVSMSTVRTQIKAAAVKVGATRQADLVRLVLTGPAVLGRPAGPK